MVKISSLYLAFNSLEAMAACLPHEVNTLGRAEGKASLKTYAFAARNEDSFQSYMKGFLNSENLQAAQ